MGRNDNGTRLDEERASRISFLCVQRPVRRGEHIVPEAIGGRWTIHQVCGSKKVCKTCNNGVLSDLDKELCSKSPISVIAADEIGGFIAQTWDVDEAAGNLLMEARPDLKRKSMTLYPQMIEVRP
jgi:hypothetical protein